MFVAIVGFLLNFFLHQAIITINYEKDRGRGWGCKSEKKMKWN